MAAAVISMSMLGDFGPQVRSQQPRISPFEAFTCLPSSGPCLGNGCSLFLQKLILMSMSAGGHQAVWELAGSHQKEITKAPLPKSAAGRDVLPQLCD